MGSISIYYTFIVSFASICTREEEITGKTIYFTPEVKDEVIMESVSKKLGRHIFNPSNQVWID